MNLSMPEIGHMNYFTVDQCGLYKVGKEDIHGCDINETFDLIMKWVGGRSLTHTIPWDPEKENKNKAKCYCKDIYKDLQTGEFFLVLWKSDTDSAGTLWGASEDSIGGNGDIVKYTNEYKGKKVVWGRPCYYWVIPKEKTIISIKFEHSVCDASLFEDYVRSCINNRVQHRNRKKETTDKGYVRISYEDDSGNRFMYRFNMSLKSVNTSSMELQKLASSVTHIIRRETILVDTKDERDEWVKFFSDFIPMVPTKPKAKKRRIEVRAEAKPNAEQIKEIIEKNAKENRSASDWDNVGFETENGVTWVDRYRLRDYISVSNKIEGIFTGKELCNEIMKNRERYIIPIKRADIFESGVKARASAEE